MVPKGVWQVLGLLVEKILVISFHMVAAKVLLAFCGRQISTSAP